MLGITSRSAEIVDHTEKGLDDVFVVLSTVTKPLGKRAAIRQAKLEVYPQIPIRDLKVINSTLDRDLGTTKRYLITITHNEDNGDEEGY